MQTRKSLRVLLPIFLLPFGCASPRRGEQVSLSELAHDRSLRGGINRALAHLTADDRLTVLPLLSEAEIALEAGSLLARVNYYQKSANSPDPLLLIALDSIVYCRWLTDGANIALQARFESRGSSCIGLQVDLCSPTTRGTQCLTIVEHILNARPPLDSPPDPEPLLRCGGVE